MNADLKLLRLMRESKTIFVPNSISEYLCKWNRHFPSSSYFAGIVMTETLAKGLCKTTISLDIFTKFKTKTILRYLNHMEKEEVFLLNPTGHRYEFEIGFNPKRFGTLFPSYEEAISVLEICRKGYEDLEWPENQKK